MDKTVITGTALSFPFWVIPCADAKLSETRRIRRSSRVFPPARLSFSTTVDSR